MVSRGSFVLVAAVGWALADGVRRAGGASSERRSRARRSRSVRCPRTSAAPRSSPGSRPTSPPACAPMRGSVWYAFDAGEERSIVVALDAEGDLDAVVDVFLRERSQITPVACRRTNRRGALTFELDAEEGASYLVRVASRANSVDGAFRLRVIEPERPATFPGERLPRRGVNTFVDRLANPDDAWSVRLRARGRLPDEPRQLRRPLRARRAPSARRGRHRAAHAVRRAHRLRAGGVGPLHAARAGAARLARPDPLPAAGRAGARPTTWRPGSGCPTTSASAAGCVDRSSTRSTSIASRSRRGAR